MKKLGFGLMRLPTTDPANAGAVDLEQTKRMVDLFIEKGFTYFDTAWMYCGFQSEPAVKEALVSRHPRDSFTLATKLNAGFFDTLEGRDDIFNQQLEKTGAGYFDYYLLHGIDSGSYQKFEDLDCFRWLMDKKEQGLVRSPGFSFHGDAPLLDEILTKHPELEFVQLQINYLDWDSQWIQSRACYEAAVKHNKPVIVMEPVKGGNLVNLPENAKAVFDELGSAGPASYAIRFAAGFPGIMMVLSGMSSMEQMLDNISFMKDFKPLNEKELEAVGKVQEIFRNMNLIPCTACRYCEAGCPKQIKIPDLFAVMNTKQIYHDWNADYYYNNVHTSPGRKASDCIKCGKCEKACPQHLHIRDLLADVAKEFEKE